MNAKQYTGLLAVVFTGCAFGSWVALKPTPVQAQVRGGDGVIMSEQLTVPPGGLQILNERGRTVGWFAVSGGNLGLTLLDANGNASVVLQASPNSRTGLVPVGGGSGLELGTPDGAVMRFAATSQSGSIGLFSGGATLFSLAGTARGGSLTLNGDKKGVSSVLAANGIAGSLNLYGETGNPVVTLNGQTIGGSLSLQTTKGAIGATLDAEGKIGLFKDGKSSWKAPTQ